MPLPSVYSITLPTLELLSDEKIHSSAEIADYLARHFNLTEAERSELVRNSRQTKLHNYAGWARFEIEKSARASLSQ